MRMLTPISVEAFADSVIVYNMGYDRAELIQTLRAYLEAKVLVGVA